VTHKRKHSRRYKWLLPLRAFGLFLEAPAVCAAHPGFARWRPNQPCTCELQWKP
jgi:hypothetical protein